ncbi:MAG: hypothetical protein J6W60_00930 [Treponema sp.]|nr:hypothetical protein [Treponema sp.]
MKKSILALLIVSAIAVIPAFSQIQKTSFEGRNYTDDQIIKINSQGYYFTYLGYNTQNTSFSTYGGDIYYSSDTEFKQDIKCFHNGVRIDTSDYLYEIGLSDLARRYEKYERAYYTSGAWAWSLLGSGSLIALGGGIGWGIADDNSTVQDICMGTTLGGLGIMVLSAIPAIIGACQVEPDLSLDLISAQTAKKNKEVLGF